MPAKNIVRVSEFEKLYFDDTKPFKQRHWEALCRYEEQQKKQENKRIEYFRILKKGIQFTNYVGVIQADNLTIEILPKIDKDYTTAANETIKDVSVGEPKEKQQWHDVLLQMLKECRLLKINHVDHANLNLRGNSILDIYLELFLSEVEILLHEGLLKKYQKIEGNQTALKGQLLFQKQMAVNITHQERFYVRYSEYNKDNIFNRILYKTICLIPRICSNPFLLDKVGRLMLDFPEVKNCAVTSETYIKLTYDRKTERYREAMVISKMILLNYRPDITGGSENVIAILFDMNKLWEEFVYRRLKREEASCGIKVSSQQSKDFWQPGPSSSKKIRPDIVVQYGKQTIIIDTKWKNIEDLHPSDNDLKQMFVYNLFWKCDQSFLLYPGNASHSSRGSYHSHEVADEMASTCGIEQLQVLDEHGKLSNNIGREIVNIFIKEAMVKS